MGQTKIVYEGKGVRLELYDDGAVGLRDVASGRLLSLVQSELRREIMDAKAAELAEARKPLKRDYERLMAELASELGYELENLPAHLFVLCRLIVQENLQALRLFHEIAPAAQRQGTLPDIQADQAARLLRLLEAKPTATGRKASTD